MTAAPTLATERLALRPHRREDFPAMAAFWASEAAAFLGGPLPERRAWYWWSAGAGDWALLGFGSWAVEERATGALAGQVWLNQPPDFPEPEIGWLLLPGFQGRGYATEAARAARSHAYGALGWRAAVSYVGPQNRASAAVALRLGCALDAAAPRPDADTLVFRHPGPEALS